jgi:glycosidase
MRTFSTRPPYFPYDIQITNEAWQQLELQAVTAHLAQQASAPARQWYRHLADRLNRSRADHEQPVSPGTLALFALLNKIFRHLLDDYLDVQHPGLEPQIFHARGLDLFTGPLGRSIQQFVERYPSAAQIAGHVARPADYLAGDDHQGTRRRHVSRELLLLHLAMDNKAATDFRILFADTTLAKTSPYRTVTEALEQELQDAPPCAPFNLPILAVLRAPLQAAPTSLVGQLEYVTKYWTALLPPSMREDLLSAFDTIREEDQQRHGGPGPSVVANFAVTDESGTLGHGSDYPEPERFSPDRDWMPDVVLMAKMVYVWLDQLSSTYGYSITRLDEIPDQELDTLAAWGFTGLWLIGLWERSAASRMIKQCCGNTDAIASAYSLYDYAIAADLGGQEALDNLRYRAGSRGIRLASDMVPNHTGIDSRWTREHPDWFVQLEYPPYPAYRFTGPDLSSTAHISLRIEDGYWSKTDAAVVFQYCDNRTGQVRYLYHGNDGTSTPWNDTAQLNYLIPEVREAVIQTILHVARSFPIIRFDAAMTLAKKHYQRLWFPQPGLGGGIPSRADHALSRARFDEVFPTEFWREVVDRVAAEAPDTLLLAEAFWLMEGYFVRTLGMHRVYNSAFMNMLKMEENAKYRQTISNVLAFNPEILQRFVNFMNNPDEKTAVEQFGREGKYFGATLLMVTMPGLPMFGHGQVEGLTEKYGMEYRRAYWNETVDRHVVAEHERSIFPLMKKRRLFSGAENFVLYDFMTVDRTDENVFVFSNSRGDERALIIYHNHFGTTSGRIQTSCPRIAPGQTSANVLVRTTLGEALACKPDGRYYYRFRDAITGLEYLRNGAELCREGLYVALEAYQYHAFLDFQEIRDDDYGTWGKLCNRLAGVPVASLSEERKLVQFSEAHVSLAKLIGNVPKILPTILSPATTADEQHQAVAVVRTKLLAFIDALNKEAGSGLDQQIFADTVCELLLHLSKVCTGKYRRKNEQITRDSLNSFLVADDCRAGTIMILVFICRQLSLTRAQDEPAWPLVTYGLDQAIADAFTNMASAGTTATGAEHLLLTILLTHHEAFLRDSINCSNEFPTSLMADNVGRSYLLVHSSDNVEWFNKERWEELARFMARCAPFADRSHLQPQTASITDLVQTEIRSALLCSAAAEAGYRTEALTRVGKVLLAPGPAAALRKPSHEH